MAEDIVTQLRRDAKQEPLAGWLKETLADAADEIERLRATVSATGAATMAYMKDIDRLRAALIELRDEARQVSGSEINAGWVTSTCEIALAGTAATGTASPSCQTCKGHGWYTVIDDAQPPYRETCECTGLPASAAPTIPEANDRADATLASADSEDAARFWWLCNDHDDRAVRYLRDSLIERMSVMSLSAVRAAIDIHLKNPSEPSHKPGTCQQCGRYLDRRGKCRLPEHNT